MLRLVAAESKAQLATRSIRFKIEALAVKVCPPPQPTQPKRWHAGGLDRVDHIFDYIACREGGGFAGRGGGGGRGRAFDGGKVTALLQCFH